MNRKKLAIVSTHPIQYHAPLFRALAKSASVQPKVFYTWSQTAGGSQFDTEFGRELSWDIPLLQGYEHEFVPNVAWRPGVDRFWGIRNPGLKQAITSWDAEAVLVFGWNTHSHLQIMRQMHGRIPVYFRGDSTLVDERPPLRRFARKMALSWVYRYIDTALAVGRNNADYFAWCGLPRRRIALAPHSVDTRRFAEAAPEVENQAASWRSELGIGAQEIVLVFAGKLIPKKAPGLLIEAFMQLQPAAHLVFFGSGELEAQLKASAIGQSGIHFLPFQNQTAMPAVYRVGDLFVLPSCGPGETWGLALNEAMACGRAIIASSKVGGARDLIRQGSNGWVFKSGNLSELRQVLSTALSAGRSTLRSMGQEGQRMAESWSTEVSAARIAEIVSQGGGRGKSGGAAL